MLAIFLKLAPLTFKLAPLTFRPLFERPSMLRAAGKGLFYNNSIWLSWAATRFSKSNEGLWIVAASTIGYQYIDLPTRLAEKLLPRISNNETVATATKFILGQIREFVSNAIVYSTLYIDSKPMISAAVSFLPEAKREFAEKIFEHVITATAIQTATNVSYGAKHASNALVVPSDSKQTPLDKKNASFFSPGNSFAGIIICAAGYIVRDYMQERLEKRIGKYPSILIAGALKGGMCSVLKYKAFYYHPDATYVIPAMIEGAVYDCFTTIAGSYLGEKPKLLIAISAENAIEKLTDKTCSKICDIMQFCK